MTTLAELVAAVRERRRRRAVWITPSVDERTRWLGAIEGSAVIGVEAGGREALVLTPEAGRPPADPAGSVVAVGWASVDLERAVRQAGLEQVGDPVAFSALGAVGAVVARESPTGLAIVVLEPVTEGPLAAALARRGEGLEAIWVGPTGEAALILLASAELVRGGPRTGPFVLRAGHVEGDRP